MFSQEYVNVLVGLSAIKRDYGQAVLFALEQKRHISFVASLRWCDLSEWQPLTPTAQKIIQCRPRHIKIDQIFWTTHHDLSHPLLDIESVVFNHFGMFWGELAFMFDQIPAEMSEEVRSKLLLVLAETVV